MEVRVTSMMVCLPPCTLKSSLSLKPVVYKSMIYCNKLIQMLPASYLSASYIYIYIRDERVQHYLYLLTILIICIRICTLTGRGLTRKWAEFDLEVLGLS